MSKPSGTVSDTNQLPVLPRSSAGFVRGSLLSWRWTGRISWRDTRSKWPDCQTARVWPIRRAFRPWVLLPSALPSRCGNGESLL